MSKPRFFYFIDQDNIKLLFSVKNTKKAITLVERELCIFTSQTCFELTVTLKRRNGDE